MEAHGYRHGAIARRSESRAPAAHYNHSRELFSPPPDWAASNVNALQLARSFPPIGPETISCSESRSVFVMSLFVCSLNEHIALGHAVASRARQEIMIRWARLYHERLLRGVAAPKGLWCCRGLHCRRGILDSNGFGGVSSVGIAQLEFAPRDCAFVNWLSDRRNTCLGIRHHTARDPRHANTWNSSATKSHFAYRPGGHHLCFCWIFSIAVGRPGESRQIRRGPPFSKLKQRSG